MQLITTGCREKSLEPRNLALFYLIAFAWSWFGWFLLIDGVLHMPAFLGTPEIKAVPLSPVILIVLIMPFGPMLAAFSITARTSVSGIGSRSGIFVLPLRIRQQEAAQDHESTRGRR
jgi:hypothetical protein